MILYVALALVLLVFAHLPLMRGYGPALDRGLAVFLIAATAAASGLAQLGTDYAGYAEHYENMEMLASDWWEPGFQLFALSAKALGIGYDGFVILGVATTLLVSYLAARPLVYNRTLFFFSLFCFQLLSSAFTRQQLAASLAFLAVSYAARGRLVAFAISSAVAASMHYSSLLFTSLVFVVFFYSRLSRMAWVACILVGLGVGAAFLGYVASSDRYAEQAAAYLAEDYVQGIDEEQSSVVRNVSKYAFYVAFALSLTLTGRRPIAANLRDPLAAFNWLVMIVSAMSVLLTIILSPVFARLSVYLFPLLAVIISNSAPLRDRWSLAIYSLLLMLLPAYLYVSLRPLAEFY